MELIEKWGGLEGEARQRVWLILDASESAVDVQPTMLAMARELLSSLPAHLSVKLYFLGNPEPYAVERFFAMGTQWAEENTKRVSLITPIWNQARNSAAATVVIGSGPIFDIEDWAGTALCERALFVTLGQVLIGDVRGHKMANPEVNDVLRSVCDPLVSVEIEGPLFMPLYWSNPGYQLKLNGGVARLAAGKIEDFSLVCRYLIEPDGTAQAVGIYKSGRQIIIPLAPAPEIHPMPRSLTPTEEAVFRAAVGHQPFTCPLCGAQHSWDMVRCLKDNPILGKAIYPSLDERGGVFVLRDYEKEVSFEQPGASVLRLSPCEVAICSSGVAHRYQCRREGWTGTGESLSPYENLTKGTYALVL